MIMQTGEVWSRNEDMGMNYTGAKYELVYQTRNMYIMYIWCLIIL